MLTKEEKEELKKEIKSEILNHDIGIKLVRDIEMPFYAHDGDAGADLRSAIDIDIKPGETVLIPLGFIIDIPYNYEIQIRPRSGLSLKTPLRISNAPGTIDSGYKDELCVILTNTSRENTGNYDVFEKNNRQGIYSISKGDRVAQMILSQYVNMNFIKINNIDNRNDRGGGFGSSGSN